MDLRLLTNKAVNQNMVAATTTTMTPQPHSPQEHPELLTPHTQTRHKRKALAVPAQESENLSGVPDSPSPAGTTEEASSAMRAAFQVPQSPPQQASETPWRSVTPPNAGTTNPEETTTPVQSPLTQPFAPVTPMRSSPSTDRSLFLSPTKRLSMLASLTPGRTLYPVSPNERHNLRRPWNSVKAPASAGRLNLDVSTTMVPPMPVKTFFMTPKEAETLPESGLRDALIKATEAASMYEKIAQQFRSAAKQYHLQNKLLTIETHESAQRHQVQSAISQREIERLITEVMGYSDVSIGAETIRRRLKKTRQRMHDLETMLVSKDHEIIALRQQLAELNTSGPLRQPKPNLFGLEMLANQVLGERAQPAERRGSSTSTISAPSDPDEEYEEDYEDAIDDDDDDNDDDEDDDDGA